MCIYIYIYIYIYTKIIGWCEGEERKVCLFANQFVGEPYRAMAYIFTTPDFTILSSDFNHDKWSFKVETISAKQNILTLTTTINTSLSEGLFHDSSISFGYNSISRTPY